MSAGVAGGDRDTAVRSVVSPPNGKPIEKRKGDIAEQKKGRRLTGRLRNAAGWG